MTLANALGWTLVHSLWEGAAISLLLALALCFARSANARYIAGCAALAALLLAFGITFVAMSPSANSGASQAAALPSSSLSGSIPVPGTRPFSPIALPPWIAPLWLAGVLLFQVRLLGGWLAVLRLRRTETFPAPEQWQRRLREFAQQWGIRKGIVLLQSGLAEVPVVIGHWRPVILVPLALLAHMPGEQIESILLHELAHIRRHDYLVNLAQTLAEALLFYHPAVWWISSLIRAERENCCDDLAVATHGNAHQYAVALTALADNRWGAEEVALAATGGSLVKRIRRLLRQPEGPRMGPGPVIACGVVLACAIGIIGHQARLNAAPQTRTESPYAKWLKEDAAYIISDRERAAYINLGSDEEREQFIKQFWERRDPTPGTVANEFKEEHYRRIAFVNGHFSVPSGIEGWQTDRGRTYIKYGPADEIESHPSGGSYRRPEVEGGSTAVTYPFEQWKYRYIEGVGTNVIVEFVDLNRSGEYRMTRDPNEKIINDKLIK